MSKQSDRDEFIALMATEGVPVAATRALLRAGATLQRLAELACNSEAADRDRVRCPGGAETCLCRDYGSYVVHTNADCMSPLACLLNHHTHAESHGTVPRYMIREARTEARVRALCAKHGLTPIFNGDPRGAVLKLMVPSGRTNDGGREGACVP